MSTKNDNKIFELQKKVEEAKENLKKRVDESKHIPITSCKFNFFGQDVNIHTLNKSTCLKYFSILANMRTTLINCGIDPNIIDYEGYSISDIAEDLYRRYRMLDYKEEEEKLKNLESRLIELLSNDARVEMEIDNLSKMLNEQ